MTISVDLWGVGWGMLALAIAWYNIERLPDKSAGITNLRCGVR